MDLDLREISRDCSRRRLSPIELRLAQYREVFQPCSFAHGRGRPSRQIRWWHHQTHRIGCQSPYLEQNTCRLSGAISRLTMDYCPAQTRPSWTRLSTIPRSTLAAVHLHPAVRRWLLSIYIPLFDGRGVGGERRREPGARRAAVPGQNAGTDNKHVRFIPPRWVQLSSCSRKSRRANGPFVWEALNFVPMVRLPFKSKIRLRFRLLPDSDDLGVAASRRLSGV